MIRSALDVAIFCARAVSSFDCSVNVANCFCVCADQSAAASAGPFVRLMEMAQLNTVAALDFVRWPVAPGCGATVLRLGATAIYPVQMPYAAGLPTLRGSPPFGGPIMSHDFVEAALMRRMGWAVHVAPGLTASYEESPPSLDDYTARDRRWCQGKSSAYRRAGGPRLTLGQPTASSNRHRLLCHGANVARVAAHDSDRFRGDR